MIKRLLVSLTAAISGLAFTPEVGLARNCNQVASYYGAAFAGKTMANGKPFNPNAMTAAHRSLPFGTRLRVTDATTGKSVVVTITDRGPFISGRTIDLSRAAFAHISPLSKGITRVCINRL